mgnify:CR=1 FL=1
MPFAAEDGFNGHFRNEKDKEIGGYLLSTAELKDLDSEGRCVVTDHGDFVLFNTYFPNYGGSEESSIYFINPIV